MTSLGWKDAGTVLFSKGDAERRRADHLRGEGGRDEPVFCGATLSRRQHKVARVDKDLERNREEAAAFDTNLGEVLDRRPESRLKWLQKALVLAGKKSLKVGVVYDIVTHEKFVAGVKDQIGAQMKAMLFANLHLFSPKQQKSLQSESSRLSTFDIARVVAGSKRKDRSRSRSPDAQRKKKRKKKRRKQSSSSGSSPSCGRRNSSASGSDRRSSPLRERAIAAAASAHVARAHAAPLARPVDHRLYASGAADDF